MPGTAAPADENAIAALEAQLGRRLPEDYRTALTASNGGRPAGEEILTLPDGGSTVVNQYFGAGAGGNYDLAGNLANLEDEIPGGMLPIAEDPGGDILLLAVDGADRGSVFYMAHDRALGHAALPDFPGIIRLAPSFAEFRAQLQRG